MKAEEIEKIKSELKEVFKKQLPPSADSQNNTSQTNCDDNESQADKDSKEIRKMIYRLVKKSSESTFDDVNDLKSVKELLQNGWALQIQSLASIEFLLTLSFSLAVSLIQRP